VGEEFVDEGVWWVSESGPPAYECKLSCIMSRTRSFIRFSELESLS
jgi:hypothetical protein